MKILKGIAVILFGILVIGMLGASCSDTEIEEIKKETTKLELNEEELSFIYDKIDIWKKDTKFENSDFKIEYNDGVISYIVFKDKIDYMITFNTLDEKEIKDYFEKDLFFNDLNNSVKEKLGDKIKTSKAFIYNSSTEYIDGEYYAMKYID